MLDSLWGPGLVNSYIIADTGVLWIVAFVVIFNLCLADFLFRFRPQRRFHLLDKQYYTSVQADIEWYCYLEGLDSD